MIENKKIKKCKRHPLYGTWTAMKTRCYNPKATQFKNYGGKGVVVCEEWKNSFNSFKDWMLANGWVKGMQIDKDIKAKALGIEGLIYSPEMCSMVTPKQNCNEKTDNWKIEYKGVIYTATVLAEMFNINLWLLRSRLERGWDLEDALTDLRKDAIVLTHNGQTKTVAEWAKSIGISPKGLRKRLVKYDWDTSKAISQPIMKNQFVFKQPEIKHTFGFIN